MNIHKFNTKPKTSQSKTIHWHPKREVKYPAIKVNSIIWKFLVKKTLNLSRRKLNNYN